MKRSGELTKLSSLFDKYKKNLKAPQKTVIDVTVEVVYDVVGFKIDPKKCLYNVSTKTLSLNISSLLKQEIKTHEVEIMNHLKGRLGEHSTPKLIL